MTYFLLLCFYFLFFSLFLLSFLLFTSFLLFLLSLLSLLFLPFPPSAPSLFLFLYIHFLTLSFSPHRVVFHWSWYLLWSHSLITGLITLSHILGEYQSMVNEHLNVYPQKGETRCTYHNSWCGCGFTCSSSVCGQLMYVYNYILECTEISSVVYGHCIRRRFCTGRICTCGQLNSNKNRWRIRLMTQLYGITCTCTGGVRVTRHTVSWFIMLCFYYCFYRLFNCVPGAFNTITGPVHWELLVHSRWDYYMLKCSC